MIKLRDIRFIIFIVLNLVAIGAFLLSGLGEEAAYTGWRKIDYQTLMEKVTRGDLVRHEALYWYEEN